MYNHINDNLEQQAKALYKAWFIDYLPFGGHIPSDWKESTLGAVITITSGKRPQMKSSVKTENASYPLIGASEVMGYTSGYLYDEKILVTGRVGTHGIVQRFSNKCWPSDNTLVIRSPYYEFAYQLLKSVDYANLNRGSTQPLLTQKDIKNIPIILPNESILEKFEKKAGLFMSPHEINLRQNEQLIEIKEVLLPRLLSGECQLL